MEYGRFSLTMNVIERQIEFVKRCSLAYLLKNNGFKFQDLSRSEDKSEIDLKCTLKLFTYMHQLRSRMRISTGTSNCKILKQDRGACVEYYSGKVFTTLKIMI